MTCMYDQVVTLKGETRCWSLLGIRGLNFTQRISPILVREMVKTIVLRQDPPLCKKTGGLFMCPLPHLKRWCLVGIAPTLSGIETNKTFKPPCAISPAI